MEEVYRNALRAIAEQAKVADMDVAVGPGVLIALLDENDKLRAERGALVGHMKKVLRIVEQGGKWKETVERITTHAHSVVTLADRN